MPTLPAHGMPLNSIATAAPAAYNPAFNKQDRTDYASKVVNLHKASTKLRHAFSLVAAAANEMSFGLKDLKRGKVWDGINGVSDLNDHLDYVANSYIQLAQSVNVMNPATIQSFEVPIQGIANTYVSCFANLEREYTTRVANYIKVEKKLTHTLKQQQSPWNWKSSSASEIEQLMTSLAVVKSERVAFQSSYTASVYSSDVSYFNNINVLALNHLESLRRALSIVQNHGVQQNSVLPVVAQPPQPVLSVEVPKVYAQTMPRQTTTPFLETSVSNNNQLHEISLPSPKSMGTLTSGASQSDSAHELSAEELSASLLKIEQSGITAVEKCLSPQQVVSSGILTPSDSGTMCSENNKVASDNSVPVHSTTEVSNDVILAACTTVLPIAPQLIDSTNRQDEAGAKTEYIETHVTQTSQNAAMAREAPLQLGLVAPMTMTPSTIDSDSAGTSMSRRRSNSQPRSSLKSALRRSGSFNNLSETFSSNVSVSASSVSSDDTFQKHRSVSAGGVAFEVPKEMSGETNSTLKRKSVHFTNSRRPMVEFWDCSDSKIGAYVSNGSDSGTSDGGSDVDVIVQSDEVGMARGSESSTTKIKDMNVLRSLYPNMFATESRISAKPIQHMDEVFFHENQQQKRVGPSVYFPPQADIESEVGSVVGEDFNPQLTGKDLVFALYKYVAREAKEMSFEKGDVIEVHKRVGNWIYGSKVKDLGKGKETCFNNWQNKRQSQVGIRHGHATLGSSQSSLQSAGKEVGWIPSSFVAKYSLLGGN
ncbi:hypothetical protein HDU79_004457 [Rhizoclosmatium sp. JEL0117]|nr:hypothetical protein HDU79_004457 [Rhizoclosmatium sp. JEL0117]